jgi:hypothetical protein
MHHVCLKRRYKPKLHIVINNTNVIWAIMAATAENYNNKNQKTVLRVQDSFFILYIRWRKEP